MIFNTHSTVEQWDKQTQLTDFSKDFFVDVYSYVKILPTHLPPPPSPTVA